MGKVKYNKQVKGYIRTININGISTIVSHPNKEFLKKLPYRMDNEVCNKISLLGRVKSKEKIKK